MNSPNIRSEIIPARENTARRSDEVIDVSEGVISGWNSGAFQRGQTAGLFSQQGCFTDKRARIVSGLFYENHLQCLFKTSPSVAHARII